MSEKVRPEFPKLIIVDGDEEVRCPSCGDGELVHAEMVMQTRVLRGVNADGQLIFDGYGEVSWDITDDLHIFCTHCEMEWELPAEGVEYD